MTVADSIAKLAAPHTSLPAPERAAVIEIAFLAVSADRKIQRAEELALRAFARALSGAAGEPTVDALFAGGIELDREAADARLRAVAAVLTSAESRALAYQGAYAVALADLATDDEEFEFDLQLIDALGLEQSHVDALTRDVVAALYPA